MSEPNEGQQPVLEEQKDEPKKPLRRRAPRGSANGGASTRTRRASKSTAASSTVENAASAEQQLPLTGDDEQQQPKQQPATEAQKVSPQTSAADAQPQPPISEISSPEAVAKLRGETKIETEKFSGSQTEAGEISSAASDEKNEAPQISSSTGFSESQQSASSAQTSDASAASGETQTQQQPQQPQRPAYPVYQPRTTIVGATTTENQPPRAETSSAAPAVEQQPQPRHEPQFAEGIVEVSGKGFGFLRDAKRSYVQSPQDVFVTPEIVRRFNLRDGQFIKGEVRRGSRGFQLFRLTEINGEAPEKFADVPIFEELTVLSPLERFKLETTPERYTTRIMDLMTPIGKGQRGIIVAPPRTGKTTLLQHIADAVVKNHPETHLIILLVDERPEEVTEIRRTVPSAELMASSNDSDIKSHTRIAQLAIERAKRLVEGGRDVFVLLDSITRVARAFNNATGGGGRTMSGGIDARAMEIPRKLFAAARNTEEAGSLTIVATALIETGSRMDELIFQEFKGTGNMELVLDRKISDLRVYPAVDIFKSGTRREELLVPADQLHKINVIRRGLAGHKPEEAIERLLMFVKKFPTNVQMLREIPG